MKSSRIAFTLCATLALSACKSELDNKPKAEVKEAKKDAKTDAKGDAKVDAKGDAKVDAKADEKADAKAEPAAGGLKVDKTASKVRFVGAKVTADHEGTFADFDGALTLGEDGKPSKLELTVKVDSMQIEPADLHKHLLSPDFFDAAQFPESSFVSSSIKEAAGDGGSTHEITGDLTLHGKTNTITFPAKVEITDASATGNAEFKIDRKLWGIEYPGMKDDLIKDEVLLSLQLSFPRK